MKGAARSQCRSSRQSNQPLKKKKGFHASQEPNQVFLLIMDERSNEMMQIKSTTTTLISNLPTMASTSLAPPCYRRHSPASHNSSRPLYLVSLSLLMVETYPDPITAMWHPSQCLCRSLQQVLPSCNSFGDPLLRKIPSSITPHLPMNNLLLYLCYYIPCPFLATPSRPLLCSR